MDILLNWLWQACAVTAAVWIALTRCRGLSATSRYQVWWTALVLVLVLPAFQSLGAMVLPAREPMTAIGSLGAVMLPPLPRWPLITLLLGWLLWVGVMASRTARAFRRVQCLKQTGIPFPTDHEARLGHWMSIRATGRRVRLVVSDDVRYAAAIGVGSPVIAVAPVVLRELDDEELDRILVHEWAHIQRRDDIARVFQLLVRVLFGFNPAVWWIDRRIEIEREVACDDQVIEITGCRTAYAKSLMKLAAVPNRPVDLALVSAALAAPKLTTRIVRLLDSRRNVSTRRSTIALILAAPGLLVLAVTVGSLTPVIPAVPNLRPLVASERVSAPPSTPTMKAHVEPAERLGDRSQPSPESDVRRQRPQTPAQPASVPVVASAGSGAIGRPNAQIVPTLLNSSDRDRRVDRTVSLAGRPISIGMTAFPVVSLAQEEVPMSSAKTVPGTSNAAESPWSAAANAGTALGRSSQQAATRTAGFFTRLSKNVAGSF